MANVSLYQKLWHGLTVGPGCPCFDFLVLIWSFINQSLPASLWFFVGGSDRVVPEKDAYVLEAPKYREIYEWIEFC